MKSRKLLILFTIIFLLVGGVILLIYLINNNNLLMNNLKKEIKNQSNIITGKETIEDKLKESWYINNPDTKIIKSYLYDFDKDGDKEFTIAYLKNNYIKVALVTAVEGKNEIDFIVNHNISTDGQKLVSIKYIYLKGKRLPSLLVHVTTDDGFHYLSIYGDDKEELLRLAGNGGIIVKDLNGDKIPEIIPITKTGQTKESSIIDVYQWSHNRFVEVDSKKYIPSNFSTKENLIKYFFQALKQGSKNSIKSCFSMEVQRNFADKDFDQLAKMYKGNAKLIEVKVNPSEEYLITVIYKSNVTKGKLDLNLTQENGKWLINDVPTMLIPGRTVFKG